MAVVVFIEWDGVTAEQYDAARQLVNWEGDPPEGGVLHVAAATERGMRITDVWESPEVFQAFVNERLTPGVTQLGITSQPRVDIQPVHALFTPAFERV